MILWIAEKKLQKKIFVEKRLQTSATRGKKSLFNYSQWEMVEGLYITEGYIGYGRLNMAV